MIRTRARGRTSGNSWFKSASYLLNNVAPALIHDYAKNRYYNTTDGVISFPVTTTRTTNATMFDSSGNLVWAPHNLFRSTVNPTLGTWVFLGTVPPTVTYGETDPFGGSSATLVDLTPAIDCRVEQTATSLGVIPDNTDVTVSFWLKRAPGETETTHVAQYRKKDASTTLVSLAVSDDWQRVSFTFNSGTGASPVLIWLNFQSGPTIKKYIFYGPQMELSSFPREYNPNSSLSLDLFKERLDYNPATLQPRGYLIEVQRTNSIRNNTRQGGVAGSPGTAPTNWSISTIPGVTITTSYGIENGIPYIEVSYNGTNTSGALAYPTITPEQTNNVAAASGQTWTHSAFAKKVSGADSESQWNVGVVGRDSGGSIVSGESAITDFVGGARLSDSRVQVSRTFVNAAVAFAQPRITRDSLGIGATMDITIRIGLPQLEQGAFATSAIPTYGVAATRSGDIANLITPPPYSATGTTYYAEFERQGTPVNSSSEASSGVWFFGTSGGTQVSAPFGFGTANQIRVDLYESGTQQCALSAFATPFTVHKLCARVAPNDARAAYDTVLTAHDTTVVMPVSIPTTVQAIGRRESATHQMHGWLKDFRIYETAAPDASLQAITA